jgi:multiple sugar transport system permease protein
MSRFTMHRSALVVLMARIIPGVSLLVPWYYVFSNLRMVGGLGVLILSHMFVALPLIVYIMMSYFDSTPLELEEAAQVDGLTPIGAFTRITLPLSLAGIATAGILSFIFSWNNFMFALVLSGANTKTLPVAIFNFVSYASIDWGGLMAAATVVTIPIMVIALFTQKYIVSGLTAGATKG